MGNKLIPMALVPQKESETSVETYIMQLPDKWKKELTNLYKKVNKKEFARIPVESLNNAVEGLNFNIIRTEKYAYKQGKSWIVANKQINKGIIFNIFKAWYRVEYIEAVEELQVKNELRERLSLFLVEDLNWEHQQIKLGDWEVLLNGTAKLKDGNYFDAIPDYMCRVISNNKIPFTVGGVDLYFRKCKNELISWPPVEHNKQFFSLVIKVMVKTQPFCGSPLIFIMPGIRRWVTGESAKHLSEDASTVYISYKPYWNENDDIFDMTTESIKYEYKQKGYRWQDKIKEIMNAFNLDKLPEVDDLRDNSVTYIKGKEDLCCAIVYSNTMNTRHFVKPGIGMIDRKDIFSRMLEIFPEFKSYSELYSIEDVKKSVAKNELREVAADDLGNLIRKSLGEACGNEMTIEVRYQNPEMAVELTKAIEEIFELGEEDKTKENVYSTEELKLNLVLEKLGRIGEKLTDEGGSTEKVKQIGSVLSKEKGSIGTLVELPEKGWKKREDPKNAIRKGLYCTGRVNQFITPIEETKEGNEEEGKNIKHRAKNAVMDLLRQFGYMPAPLDLKRLKSVPKDVDVYAVWMVNKNKGTDYNQVYIPVIIKVNSYDKNIEVKSTVFDGWIKYYDAILEVGSKGADGNFKSAAEVKDIRAFVSRFLNEIQDRPSIVIYDALNIRSCLPAINDGKIKLNEFFAMEEVIKTTESYPNLRMIRVKKGDEVPDYYGENAAGEVGFISGLKKSNSQVYYSLAKKGATMMNVNPDTSRIIKPSKDLRFPEILEIVPFFFQDQDNEEDYAYAVHVMRSMNPTYGEETVYPLPMHLARKFGEVLENK